MASRLWHAVIAALVALALVVQIAIAVQVSGTPHATTTGTLAGASALGRLIRVFSFFTIQSNVLSGVVAAALAVRPDRDGRLFRALRLAALVGITVTGVVYSAVLADVHEPHGAAETLVNTIVHYLVPILMVLGWLLFGPRPRIDSRAISGALLFPLAWLGYTLLRGAIWGWYPYPFLDVPPHGYAVVLLNSVVVTVLFLVVCGLAGLGDRSLPRRP